MDRRRAMHALRFRIRLRGAAGSSTALASPGTPATARLAGCARRASTRRREDLGPATLVICIPIRRKGACTLMRASAMQGMLAMVLMFARLAKLARIRRGLRVRTSPHV